jgi:predicted Ser/Thr protein kinase
MEETIERIVGFFRHAAQGLEERKQIAIAKTEPGDENNRNISALVGKVDILGSFGQNDPDAYGFCGGLNRANQGILEFVEMFKAPIKMLHPLLTGNGTARVAEHILDPALPSWAM